MPQQRSFHGMTHTATYKCWLNMKDRCGNPNTPTYKHYGGRGITVCDRWQKSFKDFLSDMGEKPDNLSLDRIDNNKGYYKENCRWATEQQQRINRGRWFKRPRTHCSRGHEFTEENIIIDGPSRRCKTCRRAYGRAK